MPDHILERHQQAALADRDEPVEALRHLDAGEPLLARLRVADEQAEAQREPGDVRERLAGPDRERRQDGEDVTQEQLLELAVLALVEIVDRADPDAFAARAGQSSFRQMRRLLSGQRRGLRAGSRRASAAVSARRSSGRRAP